MLKLPIDVRAEEANFLFKMSVLVDFRPTSIEESKASYHKFFLLKEENPNLSIILLPDVDDEILL